MPLVPRGSEAVGGAEEPCWSFWTPVPFPPPETDSTVPIPPHPGCDIYYYVASEMSQHCVGSVARVCACGPGCTRMCTRAPVSNSSGASNTVSMERPPPPAPAPGGLHLPPRFLRDPDSTCLTSHTGVHTSENSGFRGLSLSMPLIHHQLQVPATLVEATGKSGCWRVGAGIGSPALAVWPEDTDGPFGGSK